jgi:hypothetical protein
MVYNYPKINACKRPSSLAIIGTTVPERMKIMNKEAYILQINALVQDCADVDLLDLIYKLLLQQASQ